VSYDTVSTRPNYAGNGLLLGAIAGAIIGNNSGSLGHDAWRGAAYGAGAGLLLGAIAESSARRRRSGGCAVGDFGASGRSDCGAGTDNCARGGGAPAGSGHADDRGQPHVRPELTARRRSQSSRISTFTSTMNTSLVFSPSPPWPRPPFS